MEESVSTDSHTTDPATCPRCKPGRPCRKFLRNRYRREHTTQHASYDRKGTLISRVRVRNHGAPSFRQWVAGYGRKAGA